MKAKDLCGQSCTDSELTSVMKNTTNWIVTVEIIINGDESQWERLWTPSRKFRVTLIHVAAYCRKCRKADPRAIELSASLDDKDRYGGTALCYAAFNGSVDIVRWLLDDHWVIIDTQFISFFHRKNISVLRSVRIIENQNKHFGIPHPHLIKKKEEKKK